jgi:diguanylate cyclase (GGDEF)-like protein/PAS domain S-box-containing protein
VDVPPHSLSSQAWPSAPELEGCSGTLIADAQGHVQFCSVTLLPLFAPSMHALLGARLTRLLPELSWAPEVTRGGAPQRLVLRSLYGPIAVDARCGTLQTGTGRMLVVEVAASALAGPRPRSPQPQLKQLALAIERSSDATLITDVGGTILYVNPAFAAMTGFLREEAIGRTPAILKSGRQPAEFYRQLWHTLHAGQEYRGVVINRRKSGELFHQDLNIRPLVDTTGRITHFMATGRDISGHVATVEKLAHTATHDSLTDLPNRALFFDRLGQVLHHAARRGARFALLVLDVDRFKEVNDTLGHPAGDAVLRAVARRLGRNVRETDTVARLGGDEFGVLLTNVADAAAVVRVVQKIVAAAAAPIHADEHDLKITVSIGIAHYPSDARDEHALLKRADQAMYRAKRAGGNGYRSAAEHAHAVSAGS